MAKDDIGALWEREKNGKTYFSGTIKLENGSVLEIIAFPNDFKTKENQPDIRIYRRESQPQDARTTAAPRTAPRPAPAPKAEETGYTYPDEEINPEDIPF